MMGRWLIVGFIVLALGLQSSIFAQEGTTEQVAQITSLVWSPQGDRLAAGFDDGTVRIWNVAPDDLELGTPTVTFTPELVDTLQWTPDGESLLVSARSLEDAYNGSSTVTRWNVITGEHEETVVSLNFALESRFAFDPYFYAFAPVIAINNAFTQLALSENSYGVFLSGQGEILPVQRARRMVFSPDDTRLAVIESVSDVFSISTYNLQTGQLINYVSGTWDYAVYDMQWSADSSHLAVYSTRFNATASYANIRVYRVEEGNNFIGWYADRLWSYDHPRTDTAAITWHPVEKIIAIASVEWIEIFDISVEEPLSIIHQAGVRWMDWSPDGTRIAAARAGGTIRLYAVPPLPSANP